MSKIKATRHRRNSVEIDMQVHDRLWTFDIWYDQSYDDRSARHLSDDIESIIDAVCERDDFKEFEAHVNSIFRYRPPVVHCYREFDRFDRVTGILDMCVDITDQRVAVIAFTFALDPETKEICSWDAFSSMTLRSLEDCEVELRGGIAFKGADRRDDMYMIEGMYHDMDKCLIHRARKLDGFAWYLEFDIRVHSDIIGDVMLTTDWNCGSGQEAPSYDSLEEALAAVERIQNERLIVLRL